MVGAESEFSKVSAKKCFNERLGFQPPIRLPVSFDKLRGVLIGELNYKVAHSRDNAMSPSVRPRYSRCLGGHPGRDANASDLRSARGHDASDVARAALS